MPFPSSPTNGQVHTSGDRTWTYDSAKNAWVGGLNTLTAPVVSGLVDATTAATPNDADLLPVAESSSVLKKITFANLWAWVKSKLSTSGDAIVINGALSATAQPASPGANDVMTRALVDARYGRIGFAASNSSTSVSAAFTPASFATEIDDTNNAWDGTAFTVPETGIYEVYGVYAFTSVTAGNLFVIGVSVNSTSSVSYLIGRGLVGGTGIAGGGGATRVSLTAGDVLRMLIYSGNSTTGYNTTPGYCTFSAYKIRP